MTKNIIWFFLLMELLSCNTHFEYFVLFHLFSHLIIFVYIQRTVWVYLLYHSVFYIRLWCDSKWSKNAEILVSHSNTHFENNSSFFSEFTQKLISDLINRVKCSRIHSKIIMIQCKYYWTRNGMRNLWISLVQCRFELLLEHISFRTTTV